MARIIGTILLVALFIAALRLAIVAIVLAGLIFRTQATIGLLIICGLLSLLAAYPAVGAAALGIAAIAAILKAARWEHDPAALMDDPVQD